MATNRVALPGPPPPGSPPPRAPRPSKYDWEGIRTRLEQNPGLWLKAAEDVSTGVFSWVRQGKPQALHGMGGHLESSIRNQKETGTTRAGTLWLRWEPEGWTQADQARVEAAAAAGEGQL
jgi:hypothetical protein